MKTADRTFKILREMYLSTRKIKLRLGLTQASPDPDLELFERVFNMGFFMDCSAKP